MIGRWNISISYLLHGGDASSSDFSVQKICMYSKNGSFVRILSYFDWFRFPRPQNCHRRLEMPICNWDRERTLYHMIDIRATYGSFLLVGVFDSLVRFPGFASLASSNQIKYTVVSINGFSRQALQYYLETDQVQCIVYSWLGCWPTDAHFDPRLSR